MTHAKGVLKNNMDFLLCFIPKNYLRNSSDT